MKPYLDKQGLDTLAAEIKNKFILAITKDDSESILTLDKNSIIRWDKLLEILKYKGALKFSRRTSSCRKS